MMALNLSTATLAQRRRLYERGKPDQW